MQEINTLNDAIESISLFYAQNGEKVTDCVSLYNSWAKENPNRVKDANERGVLISYCNSLVSSNREALCEALCIAQ